MTAQEKATQLVDDFMDLSDEQEYNTPRHMSKEMAKQCALIAVGEVILAIPDASDDDSPYNHELVWWEEVEKEIENLYL